MSTNNDYRGERLSFFKLFSLKNYKLVIPILQRDYAQGRTNDDANEIRSEFLDALYSYLEENRPNRDLDFVYGTLQSDKDDDYIHFIPLDGQQRLTTLFLLHWFLFQISQNEKAKRSFKVKMMNGNKSLFTYETRQSATDFCDALMQATINMNQLVVIKGKDNKDTLSLAATLKNEPWFFRFWRNDPTIQSMLVMLDAIYHKFMGHEEFFERLLDEENPIITFIFMDLKEYKLTDDLYVKMNSRGKPLSKFENFKAKFEQYLKRFDEDYSAYGRKFTLKFNHIEKTVGIQQYFSFNIDTKWTTLLWQYCKDGKQDRIDSYIENLFRVIVANYYASVVKLLNKSTSDSTFDVLTGGDKSLTFAKYEETKVLTYNAILSVIDTLDTLYNGNQKIAHYISEEYKAYYGEDEIFHKVIENKLSRAERMQFFAYVQYLIHHRDKMDRLDDWMRVIHNLTHPDNTIADGNDDLARGIKSIEKLIPYAPNIIHYLQGVTTIDGFSKHQSSEECIKAHLIEKAGWRGLIEDSEKHPYFNGQIGFLLEFSGICKYYYANKNLNWSDTENETFKRAFIRYSKIGKFVFDINEEGFRFNDKKFCFERAVLAHGDYLLEGSTDYWNLLSTETVAKNVKRDLSWRRMLRMGEDKVMQKGKKLVKATFDDITDLNDIIGSLEKLCIPQTEEKWRNILISSPKMFEVCEKGFIYISQEEILLLKKWYLNHYHWELFTYHLWVEKFENVFFDGFDKGYAKQKCSDITPHISIKDDKYSIEIYTVLNDNNDFDRFLLTFGFNNENMFDYPDEIIEILKELRFKKDNEDVNWFSWYCKSENSVLSKTRSLTEVLFQLKQK
ncbi:MAG: DUF262 domain-containing protein [Prevotellaceae bacterium]|nr:DUF262 domain-containing protein [Prevotellaceae bacterium]